MASSFAASLEPLHLAAVEHSADEAPVTCGGDRDSGDDEMPELDDSDSDSDCSDDLSTEQSESVGPRRRLTVSTAVGVVDVMAWPSSTVGEIRDVVAATIGAPADELRLFFGGIQLADARCLADLAIVDASTIDAQKVVRGGGGSADSDSGSFDDEHDEDMLEEDAGEEATDEAAEQIAAEAAAARDISAQPASRPGVQGLLRGVGGGGKPAARKKQKRIDYSDKAWRDRVRDALGRVATAISLGQQLSAEKVCAVALAQRCAVSLHAVPASLRADAVSPWALPCRREPRPTFRERRVRRS